MRHRSVCFRSSPQPTPDALNGRLFLSRSPPRPLERSSTGQFEACSCKPTSGGHLPSLVQHHELALVFVTHDESSPQNASGKGPEASSERLACGVDFALWRRNRNCWLTTIQIRIPSLQSAPLVNFKCRTWNPRALRQRKASNGLQFNSIST
jgi:hypothetical protein